MFCFVYFLFQAKLCFFFEVVIFTSNRFHNWLHFICPSNRWGKIPMEFSIFCFRRNKIENKKNVLGKFQTNIPKRIKTMKRTKEILLVLAIWFLFLLQNSMNSYKWKQWKTIWIFFFTFWLNLTMHKLSKSKLKIFPKTKSYWN